MKKLITIALLATSLSSNAFFNNNNGWNNNGYQQDNGLFGYNPYELYDPRWYMEEMENMINEVDDKLNDNNNYSYNGYNANPFAMAQTTNKDFPVVDRTVINK